MRIAVIWRGEKNVGHRSRYVDVDIETSAGRERTCRGDTRSPEHESGWEGHTNSWQARGPEIRT